MDRIRTWLHKEKFIEELIKRRDETIKRCLGIIPDHLLNAPFSTYKFWLIEPLIKERFIPHNEDNDESERRAQNTVFKILGEYVSEQTRANPKNTNPNKTDSETED